MASRIVRLGSPRAEGEGLGIGTVRRPPRGVKKEEWASQDYFDVWFPNLSPCAPLVKEALNADDEKDWKAFRRKFVAEMKGSEASKDLDLLAAMSHKTDFSIGCYCEDESRCRKATICFSAKKHRI